VKQLVAFFIQNPKAGQGYFQFSLFWDGRKQTAIGKTNRKGFQKIPICNATGFKILDSSGVFKKALVIKFHNTLEHLCEVERKGMRARGFASRAVSGFRRSFIRSKPFLKSFDSLREGEQLAFLKVCEHISPFPTAETMPEMFARGDGERRCGVFMERA
jgi:hypothetical protein